MMPGELVHDAAVTVRHATLPMLAGVGTLAELAGNRVVLVGAVMAATAAISRTTLTVVRRTMAAFVKLDATWENAQKIPDLVEAVDELKVEKAHTNARLDELFAARDPRSRTRVTDEGTSL